MTAHLPVTTLTAVVGVDDTSATTAAIQQQVLTQLTAALAPRYRLESSAGRSSTFVHLDTPDDRLDRAGIDVVYDAGDQNLEAHRKGAESLQQSQRPPKWPVLLNALADGPVREAIADAVWIRGLVPFATTTCSARQFAVLNKDDKTVARLHWRAHRLTDPRPDPEVGQLAPRLGIHPLRGYDREAAAVVKAITKAGGWVPESASWFDEVRALAQPAPGRPAAPMTPSLPGDVVVARGLLRFLDEIEANVDGTIVGVDTEHLHDLRVAVRRSRSIITQLGGVLPADALDGIAAEFSRLGDVTTPTRDLDVYLLGFDELSHGVHRREDLAPLAAHLRTQRTAAQRSLRAALRSERFTRLCTTWRENLENVLAAPDEAAPTAGELANSRLTKAFGKAAKRARAVSATSPAEDVHDLRKSCKQVRYLLEFFAPISDRKVYKQVVDGLKQLQDVLGEFQDSEVQAAALRTYAAQMLSAPKKSTGSGTAGVGADTVLAMGELAGHFEDRQRIARLRLDAHHDAYLGKDVLRQVAKLVPLDPPVGTP